MKFISFSQTYTSPVTLFFLVLPHGISSGFASVTLPFLLVQHGFSVSEAAAITAVGLSANIWRFFWAPLTDLTLSLHRWYLIGIVFCSVTLLLLGFIPINIGAKGLLTGVVLFSQIGASFVVAPVTSFMSLTVAEGMKGRAAGWFQAGCLGGAGIGGGAGIWLSSHYSYQLAGLILSVSMLVCAFALYFVPQIFANKEETIQDGLKAVLLDVKRLFQSRLAVFTTVMALTPIGCGAASYLWSSVGDEYLVKSDTVALVTGTLSGFIMALGCVFGGWVADRIGKWWAFYGSGALLALVALLMSFSSFTPFAYISGVLVYAFVNGITFAAFSAVVLHAIGRGMPSTKNALFSAISNVAIVYMTAFDGWMHDKYDIRTMLWGETVIGLGFVAVCLFALSWFKISERVMRYEL
jgi:MFS transporter, PAT family, beta-lactamase induction signal transducer AmpG